MVCGLRFVVCGLWFVVCGLWFVVCGLWFVVCGSRFAVLVRGFGSWFWFVSHEPTKEKKRVCQINDRLVFNL